MKDLVPKIGNSIKLFETRVKSLKIATKRKFSRSRQFKGVNFGFHAWFHAEPLHEMQQFNGLCQ